jgi:hypothetical protein
VAAEADDEAVADVDRAVVLPRGIPAQDEGRERLRPAVSLKRLAEVYVGGELAVDDDEVVAVEQTPCVADGAARAEDDGLLDVVKRTPNARPSPSAARTESGWWCRLTTMSSKP